MLRRSYLEPYEKLSCWFHVTNHKSKLTYNPIHRHLYTTTILYIIILKNNKEVDKEILEG